MFRRTFVATLFVLAFSLSNVTNTLAIPPMNRPSQSVNARVGLVSTANATQPIGPTSPLTVQNVDPIRLTTAKSLRDSDFAPIIETSLFTTNDYAAYAWIYFRTGSSYATIRIRWRWFRPDGTYFNSDSPWWNFGSEGKAAAWLELRSGSLQSGRWQVKYYAQYTEGGS